MIAPYLGVAGCGIVLVAAGAALEFGASEGSNAASRWAEVFASILRSLGGAALIGSVVGPLVSRRVQEEALKRILRDALAAVYGAHAPPKYACSLGRYLGQIRRVTTERNTTLRLDWADEKKTVLRVAVTIKAHGTNITANDFLFQDLTAPASYRPNETCFKHVTFAAGTREDWSTRFELEGNDLARLAANDEEGRTLVDLRGKKEKAVLRPGEDYQLDKTIELLLPSSWVYVLESYAAHLTQLIAIVGDAVPDLDITAVLANKRLQEEPSDGKPDKPTRYKIKEAIFPGQTTIMSWRPRTIVDVRDPEKSLL
ncbi:MAG TPA: hypothetical protein VEU29_04340 [Actinomycetota bacterium]|nr:hypothetical protein [Actinomycetota bacterium]